MQGLEEDEIPLLERAQKLAGLDLVERSVGLRREVSEDDGMS